VGVTVVPAHANLISVPSSEHEAAKREYNRRRYATPEGRTKVAAQALKHLRHGGSLTPNREHSLKSAGGDYWSRADAILAARQRDGSMVLRPQSGQSRRPQRFLEPVTAEQTGTPTASAHHKSIPISIDLQDRVLEVPALLRRNKKLNFMC
jgi:hypothetical protein